MKILAGIVGGFIIAVLGTFLVTLVSSNGGIGGISFFVFWIVGIIISVRSASSAKAWRKLLLSSAVLSFLLPIAGLIFTGSFIAMNVDSNSPHAGAQAAGAVIGGSLISGAMGFIGFFLGIVFLIIGLLVGRDKQIVYVHAPPAQTNEQR